MSVFLRRSCGAVLAYAVISQGALADVTAQDVWADWQAYMGQMGYAVSGEPVVDGNVTTITNMDMSMTVEDDTQVRVGVPELTLTENSDGTVSIDLPERFPMALTGEGPDTAFSGDLIYTHDGLEMRVSGTPEAMTYDYSAAALGITLENLSLNGEDVPAEALAVDLGMTNLTGSSAMKIGATRDIDQKFKADELTYGLVFQSPDDAETGNIRGTLKQVGLSGLSVIPEDFDANDPQTLYGSGFAFSGEMTYGAGNTAIAGTSEGQEFSVSSESSGGRFGGSFDTSRLAYDVQQNSTKVAVTTADLPFPIEVAMENAGFKFEFPLEETEEVQPFAFGLNLTDFTMSDVLWSLFDPAASLPRDPATIALDLSGTAKVLTNFFDPAAIESLELEGQPPAEVHSLNVTELLVSMVGAKLTGEGEFTFDNSGPVPAPAGVANLSLDGANGLIDTLIGMGMMSDSDALGARMMLGLMAVPGDDPDTLTSKIEFTEDGHITANGQRIK